MTDARFPERWLNDRRVTRLSHTAFRLFVISLAWSASNRTDGVIYADDVDLMPRVDRADIGELTKAGLWIRDRDRWVIPEFAHSQTTSAQLAALDEQRRKAREKKARQRAAKRTDGTEGTANVPGDVPGDVLPDYTGQARTGQDRPGQAPRGKVTITCPDCGDPVANSDIGVGCHRSGCGAVFPVLGRMRRAAD